MHANQRRKTNHISLIQGADGRILNEVSLIGEEFSNFYHDLFTSSNSSTIASCLDNLDTCVTNDMNQLLMTEFTKLEVKEAIFKMNSLGPLGPDGFSACFYQNNWSILEKDISN